MPRRDLREQSNKPRATLWPRFSYGLGTSPDQRYSEGDLGEGEGREGSEGEGRSCQGRFSRSGEVAARRGRLARPPRTSRPARHGALLVEVEKVAPVEAIEKPDSALKRKWGRPARSARSTFSNFSSCSTRRTAREGREGRAGRGNREARLRLEAQMGRKWEPLVRCCACRCNPGILCSSRIACPSCVPVWRPSCA